MMFISVQSDGNPCQINLWRCVWQVTPHQPTRLFSATSSSTPQTDNPPPPPTSDPKTLRRRRALDYLSRMPSPPPLGPLGSLASPACVKKTFNPPRRSTTPAAVATTRHVVAVETTTPAPRTTGRTMKEQEEEWENDEGLAQIDTQVLHGGGEASWPVGGSTPVVPLLRPVGKTCFVLVALESLTDG